MSRPSAKVSNYSTNSRRKDQKLLNSLKHLGFTDHESRVYLALCQFHPATGYEMSKVAQLARSNSYDVLKSLEMKGAIQPVSEGPIRYVPRDPEEFFRGIVKDTREICESLSMALKKNSNFNESIYIWALHGEKKIQSKISEIIVSANHHVWIKAFEGAVNPFAEEIALATERGVEVILIPFGDPTENKKRHPSAIVFPHEGTGAKFSPLSDVLIVMTADSNEMLVAVAGDQRIASYSRNMSMIFVIEGWILHEIYLAEIYAKHSSVLEASNGIKMTSTPCLDQSFRGGS